MKHTQRRWYETHTKKIWYETHTKGRYGMKHTPRRYGMKHTQREETIGIPPYHSSPTPLSEEGMLVDSSRFLN